MKLLTLAFVLTTIIPNFAIAQKKNADVIPPASKMPKVLRCGVYGNRISDGRGSVLLAKGATQLVYNKAKPKVEKTAVKSPWSKETEYRYFISWKLNSRKTKPVVVDIDTSKIDITNPKAGAIRVAKGKMYIKPSMISYSIPNKTSFEESAMFGFDLVEDKRGNALKMQYLLYDVKSKQSKSYTSYGAKEGMGLYAGSHDYTYFSMFSVVHTNDPFHKIFRDEASNPDSYIKNLRYVVKNRKAYLGKFTVVCTLRDKL